MKTATQRPRKRKVIKVAAYLSINLAAFLFLRASFEALGHTLRLLPLELVQELAALKSLIQGFGY
jgi:hypothetical protein